MSKDTSFSPRRDALICGVDLGTSKCAAALIRLADAVTVAEAARPHRADVTGLPPEWSEQAPSQILDAAVRAVRDIDPELRRRVVALAVTGQMHGVLLAGQACETLSNLVTWQDRRCSDEFIARLRAATGRLDVQPGYGAATLAWLQEHRGLPGPPAVACTIHDYLVWRLCGRGRPCTDPTNAASWGLFDAARGNWVQEAWEAVGVASDLLPDVVPCGTVAGRLTDWAAERIGLPAGIPVTAAVGDNQASVLAALRNQRSEEVLVLTLGTGGQLSAVIDADEPLPWIEVGGPVEVRPFPGNRRLVVAAALCGGSAFAWLVETVCAWCRELGGAAPEPGNVYRLLDQAGVAADGGGLEWIPRFLGERGRPNERAELRGITPDNVTPGNVARSLARGIVRNLADMLPETIRRGRSRVVGTGNALRRLEVMRKAVEEVFDASLELTRGGEEAAAGAAMVARDAVLSGNDGPDT